MIYITETPKQKEYISNVKLDRICINKIAINMECLKYLAGIIDGEGNLGVYKSNHSSYHLVFKVRNTCK